MITIPQKNPGRAAAIALALGITTILVNRLLPGEVETWRQIVELVGGTIGGTGLIQFVRAPT